MKVKNTDINDLKAYDKNPRNNANSIDKVADSISEFGFRQPIVEAMLSSLSRKVLLLRRKVAEGLAAGKASTALKIDFGLPINSIARYLNR